MKIENIFLHHFYIIREMIPEPQQVYHIHYIPAFL